MVCLGAFTHPQAFTLLLILNEGTLDPSCYMKSVLPVALKNENEAFGNKWIFQKDGANLLRHHLTEEWCRDNLPSLIDKDR